MRFYKPHTKFYCGIDVHSRIIYICIIGENKKVLVHRKLKNMETDKLSAILKPYKDNIVIACESTFAWYWLSDFCAKHGVEFILGHPYYMKAISFLFSGFSSSSSHVVGLLIMYSLIFCNDLSFLIIWS